MYKTSPSISVIMPVFNGEGYIQESIQSVLDQTFENFELIVIDDGSTDSTEKIVNGFKDERIIFIQQSNNGPAVARNKGIERARGNYIAILDSDDIALPERLYHQKQFLDQNLDYCLIGCNAHIIDMSGTTVYTTNALEDWNSIQSKAPASSFIHSSVMYRKEHFLKIGGYRPLYSMEDSFLIFQMMSLGKMTNLKEPLIKYRLVPNSVTSKSGKDAKLISSIYNEVASTNNLSTQNRIILEKLKQKSDTQKKLSLYYLHLSKKYLWNNYKPVLSRHNSFLALKSDLFNHQALINILISFMPKFIINKVYSLKR